MEIIQLANKARKSISNYCINECNSFCCRKGFIVISFKESDLITKNKTAEYEVSGNLIPRKDGFALNLGMTCPSLKDNKCIIHKNKGRPTVCSDFPIFIEEKEIRISQACPAVMNNLLYAHEKKFLKLGYKIRH